MKKSRLKVRVSQKEEDGIILPVYRTIPIEEDFIKVFNIMYIMMSRLDRVSTLLIFFLVKQKTNQDLLYNNKSVRNEFIKECNKNSKDTLKYTEHTVSKAFSRLKKEGILLDYEDVIGAYKINPAFIFIGDKGIRNNKIGELQKLEDYKEAKQEELEQIINE